MIKLQPVLKDYLWGGEKLKTLFGREKDGIIAESWEVSIHKDGESTISGTDKTFAEYLKENKNAVDLNGGEYEKLSGNNGEIRNLTACKYFRTRELKLNGKYAEKNDKTFTAINFVAGSGEINGEKFVSGDSFFIPCGEEFTVNGKATAILTTENTLKYYAGIDLGGTGIKCGIVDENGKIVAIKKCPTKKGVEAKEILLDMANLVKNLQKETGLTLEGVGVGCPGLIDTESGNVVYSNNLVWKNVPLIKTLTEELNLPVYVTNDANAAALGEYYFGAEKKYKSLVMLMLGTGVGSGIVFNGKLFEGNLGAGVELGHEVIKIGGGNCPFGYKFVKSGVITKKGRELVKLEIVPEEIEIVKYIFEKTVYDGYGTFRLSEEMNRRGIKTHAGAKFQPHSINRILRNKVYLGIFERGGKRSPVNESIRIITEKEYDEAQRIMAQRTNRA